MHEVDESKWRYFKVIAIANFSDRLTSTIIIQVQENVEINKK